jgi:hypothetical protein
MGVYRTPLIAVLALVVGFALAEAMRGCPSSKQNVVILPQTIKGGDTLKWKGIDSKIGKLKLTIPDGLCTQPPLSDYYQENHVYVISVSPQGGECTVKNQSGNSAIPIPWYYKYQFTPGTGGASASPDAQKAQPPVELLNIVGSCDGCRGREGPGVLSNPHGYVQEQVELIGDSGSLIPHVVDGDDDDVPEITVPPTKASVYWQLQGPGALSFTFDPKSTSSYSPCTEIKNGVLKGPTCTIPLGTRPGGTYAYYVSVDKFSSSTAANVYNYKLTLQASPPAAPKQ